MYMMDKEGYGEEITEPDIPEITFDDVADGAWYADYVKMAADAGLIKGKGEGKVRSGRQHDDSRGDNSRVPLQQPPA